MDKMRVEFEAWARDQGYCLRRTTWDGADYVEHGAESAWLGWQASRAALAGKGGDQ